jgi:hypothetical protein
MVKVEHVREYLNQSRNQVGNKAYIASLIQECNYKSSFTTKGKRMSIDNSADLIPTYVPQLLEAKLGENRPFVNLYTNSAALQNFRVSIERLYMKHRAEFCKIRHEKLQLQRQEKLKVQKQTMLVDKNERADTRRLISEVNKIVLASPRADEANSEQMDIFRLQRPTVCFNMSKKFPG